MEVNDSSCKKRYALDVVQRTAFLDKEPAECVGVIQMVYALFACIVYLLVIIVLVVCRLVGQLDEV